MRKNFLSVCILFFLVLVNPTSSLAVTTPALGAKSWLLMDVVSNQVLASRHAEEKTTARAASKLMTTYLVFGALKEGRLSLKQSVVIPEKIAVLNSGGSRMFLQAGGKATVQELLYGLIVHDADDAALVLSLVVSGDEKRFVELMNQESLRLGMKSTLYASPFGSGKGGYSTLADLAVLAANVIREYPAYYFNFSVRELTTASG